MGTGNSAGFPVYGCNCSYCDHARQQGLKRTPCSGLVRLGDAQFLVDAGQTQLRERFAPGTLQGIFITHFHPDHVQGLLEFRWGRNVEIPVYAPQDDMGCADLYKYPGILQFQALLPMQTMALGQLHITALPLCHSKPTLGYVFAVDQRRIAYLTDTKGLPEATLAWLQQSPVDILVIDCSFVPGEGHNGHNDLDDIHAIVHQLRAARVVLTHIGHDLHVALEQQLYPLPDNVEVGYDGLQVRV